MTLYPVVTRLCADHVLFEQIFREIERQCVCLAVGKGFDAKKLGAAICYLNEHEKSYHHEIEERIGSLLNKQSPGYDTNIYDLSGDHSICHREFERFRRCFDNGELHACTIEEAVDCAKSYIGIERAHFISEEELFFPYAIRHLTHRQWRTVNKLKALAEADSSLSPDAPALKHMIGVV